MDAVDLDAEADAYDRAVDRSTDVDRFCSASAFVQSAFLGLQPGRTARVFRAGGGYLAFAERRVGIGGDPRPRRLWEPLEAMWGLACPLVGEDVEALGDGLRVRLAEAREAGVPAVLVCGLSRGGPRLRAAVSVLAATHTLHAGEPTLRSVASLAGGLDGFLARRGAAVRKQLRRARRAAEDAGVRVEHQRPTGADEAGRLYARAVAIDDGSWKGRAEAGLRASGLHAFYAEMLPRLAARGALRMTFLVEPGGEDVAYLFGGVHGDTFRGLQFAFRAGREAGSLGNVAQLAAIEALVDEGVARYDLGVRADYKRRWAEEEVETVSVFAVPR